MNFILRSLIFCLKMPEQNIYFIRKVLSLMRQKKQRPPRKGITLNPFSWIFLGIMQRVWKRLCLTKNIKIGNVIWEFKGCIMTQQSTPINMYWCIELQLIRTFLLECSSCVDHLFFVNSFNTLYIWSSFIRLR